MQEVQNYFFSARPYASIAVAVIAIIFWKYFKKLVFRSLSKHSGSHAGIIVLGMNLLKYFIALVVVMTVLRINGVSITSLTAGIGIASIVVGFALQNFLNDFVMGTSIVWDGFFSLGDILEYNGIPAKVIKFNFMVTKLQSLADGNIMVVSNHLLSEVTVISSLVNIDLPAPYEVPSSQILPVIDRLCKAIQQLEGVSSARYLGIQNFDPSAILYRIQVDATAETKYAIRRQVLSLIQKIYEEEGISIPYDQLDVHLHNVSPSPARPKT